MKKILFISLLSAIVFACATKTSHPIVEITVSPNAKKLSALVIKMQFKPDPSGKTYLFFNNEAWGEQNLFNCIDDFKLVDTKGEVVQNRDSNRIEITHSKDLDILKITYQLKQDSELPLTSKKTYRPIVQPTYFQTFAHSLFILPEYLGDQPKETFILNISWDFPEGFMVHNSFGSNEKEQQILTNFDEMGQAFFAGGDFRVHHFGVKENDIYFSTRGDWKKITDEEVLNVLKKTIRSQREFWNDHSQSYFTVNLIPTERKNGSSLQGTGLVNSFAASASNNEFLDIKRLAWLFNHELMHNWIGHTIRNENEEQQYWFSEGFTEYYTYKNSCYNEIGGHEKSDFFGELNQTFKRLMTSPVVSEPNSAITYENFWASRDYEKLPYHRGAIFAFYLDFLIQKDSDGKHNLDDLMLDFLKDAKKADQLMNAEYFTSKANNYLKADITSFFNRHIIDGVPYNLPAMMNHLGFQYDSNAQVFTRGYTANQDTRIVETVDDQANAYKAGLRVGDKIIGIDMYSDPNIEANLTVRREGKELEFSFYPSKKMNLPQITISNDNLKRLKV